VEGLAEQCSLHSPTIRFHRQVGPLSPRTTSSTGCAASAICTYITEEARERLHGIPEGLSQAAAEEHPTCSRGHVRTLPELDRAQSARDGHLTMNNRRVPQSEKMEPDQP
jgi:hypothetical protein